MGSDQVSRAPKSWRNSEKYELSGSGPQEAKRRKKMKYRRGDGSRPPLMSDADVLYGTGTPHTSMKNVNGFRDARQMWNAVSASAGSRNSENYGFRG
jgi:hypothetical protein